MDANQLAEAIARAVELAKPATEYCFLWIDWWPMCMTKPEWSGWMQVAGAFIAIMWASKIATDTFKRERQVAADDIADQRLHAIMDIAELLERAVHILGRVNALCSPPFNRSHGKFLVMSQYKIDMGGESAHADLFAIQVLLDALRASKTDMLRSSILSAHLIDSMFVIERLRQLLTRIAPSVNDDDWAAFYAFGAFDEAYQSLMKARKAFWDTVVGGKVKLSDLEAKSQMA